MIALSLAFAMGLAFGHFIGWRRCRASMRRKLKPLSDAVSETGKSSDALAESISRNKQTKDKT